MTRMIDGKKMRSFGVLSLALSCAVATQGMAQEGTEQSDLPSPTELMDRHIEAVGGKDKIKEFTSRKVTGTFGVPSMGMAGATTMLSAHPNKMLMIMDIEGMGRNIQGYNGKVGWAINEMTGAMLLEDEMLDQASRDAEFYADLNYGKMYATLETVGEVEFAGKKAYKVRQITDKDVESFTFFDVESGMVVGTEAIASSQMGEIPVSVVMSDYKEFDGLKLATKTTINQMGMEVVITIETVEHNKVDEAEFETPEEIKALIKASDDADDGDGDGDGNDDG